MSGETIIDTRLLVSTKRDDKHLTCAVYPVLYTTDGVRNITDTWSTTPHAGLADLRITASADVSADPITPAWYAWEVGYRDVYLANLARCKLMVKTLGAIERKLLKAEATFGPAETFPAYVARVANALNITAFGRKVGRDTGWHDSTEYRWMDVASVQYHIDVALSDARKSAAAVSA